VVCILTAAARLISSIIATASTSDRSYGVSSFTSGRI